MNILVASAVILSDDVFGVHFRCVRQVSPHQHRTSGAVQDRIHEHKRDVHYPEFEIQTTRVLTR